MTDIDIPFASIEAAPKASKSSWRTAFFCGSVVLSILLIVGVGWLLKNLSGDKYRTLEAFPAGVIG